ncbi:uncharacterized protein ACIBXB_002854 isoform 1-T1 [Morphnus guianensis]
MKTNSRKSMSGAHPNKSDRVDKDQPKGASAAGGVERSAGSLGGRVQPSSHPPACRVVSHQDGCMGTTQCHLEEQQWLRHALQRDHPPVGLECHFAIKLDSRSHKIIAVTSSCYFPHCAKEHCAHRAQGSGRSSGCSDAEHPGVPRGGPCPHPHPSPFPSLSPSPLLGWEGAQQGCAASAERVCSSEEKLSWSKSPLHRIRPNTNCLESRV